MPLDLYEALQVSPNAEPDIIDSAYRRLALKYHPDVNHSSGTQTRMTAINQAYAVLRDPVRRARYDTENWRASSRQRDDTKEWRPSPPQWEEPKQHSTARPAPSPSVTPREHSSDFRVGLALVLAVGALVLALDMHFVGASAQLIGGSVRSAISEQRPLHVADPVLADEAVSQDTNAVNAAFGKAFSAALATVLASPQKDGH